MVLEHSLFGHLTYLVRDRESALMTVVGIWPVMYANVCMTR